MNVYRLLILVLLPLVAFKAEAGLLQIVLEGEAFNGASINVGYEFAGLSGDVIELHDVKSDVHFRAKNGYRFSVELSSANETILVESISHMAPNCKQPLQVSWKKPTIYPPTDAKIYSKMIVSAPVFGKPEGEVTCWAASMASCDSRKIILKANTTPSLAEIWIDGERLNQKTNVTLSVPYCRYEKTKRVVYRLPGRVNCQQDLDLKPDAVVEASCELAVIDPNINIK